jgi:hypothetical protein
VRPGMASIPGSMLLCASSPYARRGALWDGFNRHHGKDDAPVLVWQAPTRVMNPTVPQRVIDEAVEADPASAAAEYLAQFRTDVESYISLEAVKACISLSCRERQPNAAFRYFGFVDPSGGSADAMTLAIAHKEGNAAVLDLIREAKPPFSPEGVVKEFADTLRRYRVTKVFGDRWGGDFVREAFRKNGIVYEASERTKSELYCELLPLINSRVSDLLDHTKMVQQLVGLERRTGRSGRDSIDHFPGGHDDIANAVAGAIVLAHEKRGDGKAKAERRIPLPVFDHRPSYGERGVAWMAGPRRWN